MHTSESFLLYCSTSSFWQSAFSFECFRSLSVTGSVISTYLLLYGVFYNEKGYIYCSLRNFKFAKSIFFIYIRVNCRVKSAAFLNINMFPHHGYLFLLISYDFCLPLLQRSCITISLVNITLINMRLECAFFLVKYLSIS